MAIIVATGVVFGTYKAEWWGGKTLPKPTELGIAKSAKTHEFSADDVAKSLHQKGFKTETKTTFSGKPKGSFISYNGVEAGKRYNSNGNPRPSWPPQAPAYPKAPKASPCRTSPTASRRWACPSITAE